MVPHGIIFRFFTPVTGLGAGPAGKVTPPGTLPDLRT
jgi:hypothetical protein